VDEDQRPPSRHDAPASGDAPTLGNAVYRWASSTLTPLPYPIRVTVIALIIAFLVFLPLVLFLILVNGA
jgi:hypothetical protein